MAGGHYVDEVFGDQSDYYNIALVKRRVSSTRSSPSVTTRAKEMRSWVPTLRPSMREPGV